MQQLLTRDQTATYLHVTTRTLRRWTNDGKIIPCRIGRRVLFTQRDIEALIEIGRANGSKQAATMYYSTK
jgi:excisionase family DNA binding protein